MRKLTLGVLSVVFLVACSDGAETVAPASGFQPQAVLTIPSATLVAPVFGLATRDGNLLAAQTFVGVTVLRNTGPSLLAPLGGVTGVTPVRGGVAAITGAPFDPSLEPNARKLFRVANGQASLLADLGLFEETVNPDKVWNTGPPDSNPFNIALISGERVLVADAAGNDILSVNEGGGIDWVAVLTPQLVPTAYFLRLIGCPGSGAPECTGLPDRIPAQPVATSIAVGPDGNWYAGELTGFPGTPGYSRIWRIAAGSKHVLCPSSSCTQVASGLTSIVDMKFGPNGLLYVVELDADSWIAVEVKAGAGPLAPSAGGRIKACNVQTGVCSVIASGLSLPTAITIADGAIWVAENSGIPGVATVHIVP